jgi:hypothetical protein
MVWLICSAPLLPPALPDSALFSSAALSTVAQSDSVSEKRVAPAKGLILPGPKSDPVIAVPES